MIRHIVMFKLKEFQTPAEKQAKMQEIKDKLEALINKIDVLKMIRVDFNCNPAETWDIILTTELPTLEDVNTYANHPEHVAVAKGIIGPVKADRACVDYEIHAYSRFVDMNKGQRFNTCGVTYRFTD